jgi:hypothetical protein
MINRRSKMNASPGRFLHCLLLSSIVLFTTQVSGQSIETTRELQQLTAERQMLTDELNQYRKSLDLLKTDDTAPEESANPAIRSLAIEAAALKKRLIAIAEQEVTLLQQQIIAARNSTNEKVSVAYVDNAEAKTDEAIESKPLRSHNIDYTQEQEAENVARLHGLLTDYYLELQESARILPTEEEIAERKLAQQDADTLERIPYSVDKVRLSGSEGSTALAEISRRLMDSRIPESRRDIAPICLIKTRLFDTLIISENRSLRPVGKNHYIARVRIQPGDTTLTILSKKWELRLPQHVNASDFLITLYRPVEGTPELHVFAVEDLLALENSHIPAWLPDELDLMTKAG